MYMHIGLISTAECRAPHVAQDEYSLYHLGNLTRPIASIHCLHEPPPPSHVGFICNTLELQVNMWGNLELLIGVPAIYPC